MITAGIGGLQWKKHHGEKVAVVLNELDAAACEEVRHNCARNGFTVSHDESHDGSHDSTSIEVTNLDANVLMHQRQFDFMYVCC